MIKPRKLIAGNWKMNGLLEGGRALADELRRRLDGAGTVPLDLAVFPPATLVLPIAELLRGSAIAVGSQDCHPKEKGAHTGDVSAAMLADAGASHVIIGHSERRQDHGETDALVATKAAAAHAVGLIAIVCVGETRQQREAGKAGAVVAAQVTGGACQSMGDQGGSRRLRRKRWAPQQRQTIGGKMRFETQLRTV